MRTAHTDYGTYNEVLPLAGITEEELAGILLIEFPYSWSMEKSRAVLDGMVRREGWSAVSPGAVWCAFAAERRRITSNLPPDVRRLKAEKALAEWRLKR